MVSKVSRLLKPGGRVFFVDQQDTARQHEQLDDPDGEIATRTLMNGRTFKVVKHFYSPEEIKKIFSRHAIDTQVTNTPNHFYYATGPKRCWGRRQAFPSC